NLDSLRPLFAHSGPSVQPAMSAPCQKRTLLHHNMLISRKQLNQAMKGVSYQKLSPAIITSRDA
ncbi:hypothetical protein WCE10_20605, partial [Cronobacter muytjensii]|uniref:hypothetical protein n=1 Tax=Cronobacter muytjensii TaxID=413501 RepID=UPI0034D6BC85